MSFVPAWHMVGDDDAPHLGFVLHGILGSGRNWRSFARRVVNARPQWRLALVDLRGHGDSGPAPGPQTVARCAADLVGLHEVVGVPDTLMGHSFGGKVALVYARDQRPVPVHILDSRLDRAEGQNASNNDVLSVLSVLGQVRVPAPDRKGVGEQLRALGLGPTVTQWLLTSLKRSPDGWVWKLDLTAIDALIADYLDLDLVDWLRGPDGAEVHLVRAARSSVWSPESIAVLDTLDPRVTVTTLENADHWLHVTDPEGLLGALVPRMNA